MVCIVGHKLELAGGCLRSKQNNIFVFVDNTGVGGYVGLPGKYGRDGKIVYSDMYMSA